MSRWDAFTDDELDAIVNAFEDADEWANRDFDDIENKLYDEMWGEWANRGGADMRVVLLAKRKASSDPGSTV